MGEVNESEDAIDHRISEGDESIHCALAEPGHDKTLELGPAEFRGGLAVVGPTCKGVIGIDLLGDERQQTTDDQPDEQNAQEQEEPINTRSLGTFGTYSSRHQLLLNTLLLVA